MKIKTKADLERLQQEGERLLHPSEPRIMVGMATCCIARGADKVMSALEEEVKKKGIKASVVPVGCMGLCHREPTIEIDQPGKPKVTYGEITPDKVSHLLKP